MIPDNTTPETPETPTVPEIPTPQQIISEFQTFKQQISEIHTFIKGLESKLESNPLLRKFL